MKKPDPVRKEDAPKRDIVRKEDAQKYLDLANRARATEEANAWALMARMDYAFGTLNENLGQRGDRRGGHIRKGTAAGVALMREISKATGERRPFTLARLAVESGKLELGDVDPLHAQQTLVRAFRRSD